LACTRIFCIGLACNGLIKLAHQPADIEPSLPIDLGGFHHAFLSAWLSPSINVDFWNLRASRWDRRDIGMTSAV
jgi:hypothetical protein